MSPQPGHTASVAKRKAKLDAMSQRELIDKLAESISRLCHTVIAKRLEQFFEVIGEEISKPCQCHRSDESSE